jgi:hypothetical protein
MEPLKLNGNEQQSSAMGPAIVDTPVTLDRKAIFVVSGCRLFIYFSIFIFLYGDSTTWMSALVNSLYL